jgi:hypothetical protein
MDSTSCHSQLQQLRDTIDLAIRQFQENTVCRRVDTGDFELADYQNLLRMIFHQVREGPFTFALAGVNCGPHLRSAKEYFLHHAEEEKLHWRWVLNDLKETGYASNPESLLPLPACQDYISFNYYVAMRMPIARIAIAMVLEGIGARYGAYYARKICQLLSLTPQQTQFYAGHGNTDREHILDLWRVIESYELNEDEWQWMNYAAQTASRLYRRMYEEALEH